MRAALVLALAVSITSLANSATIDPSEAWRPMRPFIGTWKGTRTGAEGPVKVTRGYAAATTNHHLEITEKANGKSGPGVWGMVSFDPQRQLLVLRQFGTDGSTSDVVLDPATASTGPLVFASPETEGPRTRITYAPEGSKGFVERIERSSAGESFALVSETKFVRKD